MPVLGFSTADLGQMEITNRRCAVVVSRSGYLRAPSRKTQCDVEVSSPQTAGLVSHLRVRPDREHQRQVFRMRREDHSRAEGMKS